MAEIDKIPDYQTLMLPVLKIAGDGKEHRISEVVSQLGQDYKLTAAELDELLPSGKQTVFGNRVHWAKTYLSQSKLVDNTRWGRFTITDRGRSVLAEKPARIDRKYLSRFAEFNTFVGGQKNTTTAIAAEPNETEKASEPATKTPDELLRSTIGEMEAALASELLSRILAATPAFFEQLIVDLLLAMGYGGSREGAGRAIGKSGDGGLDGVIDQDQLGLDRIYIQAKRYNPDNPVSEPDIRGFSGSLGANKATKGVFVTTAYFTKPAIDFAERTPHTIVLIDGKELTRLMIRHSVGVRVAETLYVKKIDEETFSDEQ
jgi:restriction system protein